MNYRSHKFYNRLIRKCQLDFVPFATARRRGLENVVDTNSKALSSSISSSSSGYRNLADPVGSPTHLLTFSVLTKSEPKEGRFWELWKIRRSSHYSGNCNNNNNNIRWRLSTCGLKTTSNNYATSGDRKNADSSSTSNSGKVVELHDQPRTSSEVPPPTGSAVPSETSGNPTKADHSTSTSVGTSSQPGADKIDSPLLHKMSRDISLDRNFITPLRAMTDFLLSPKDLEGMRKTMRRSAHADEPPITVYWRKDIEAKAVEIWGSLDILERERKKRSLNSSELQEAAFELRKIMKHYRKNYPEKDAGGRSAFSNVIQGSGKIVLTAVAVNGTNFVIKVIAWVLTGSHSLFAEAIHSLADTMNQLILVYGIHKSTQGANLEHPYGYTNMRHVASLVSGVGIFCVGAGLSFYHGIIGLIALQPLESLYYAFFILGGSLISEGATLIMAINSVRKRSRELNVSFKDFILRSVDPALNVVIMEDSAAVAGVVVAGACMGLTALTGNAIYDAAGSLIIGGILGAVASFIIHTNGAALVGRSIPRENLIKINNHLEQDVMIRAIHDVKGIDIGNSLVRYKAEVDFDGRELTRAYLERIKLVEVLQEMKAIQSQEELEQFMLKHGEAIVDTLGAEIDRIEQKLRKQYPEIRHCDLEIL